VRNDKETVEDDETDLRRKEGTMRIRGETNNKLRNRMKKRTTR
jgi:hypothetical protein